MILVTGATGYLGKKITEKLGPKNAIGISRTGGSSCSKHINCDIRELTHKDVSDEISAVIHLAAIKSNKSRDLADINVGGTKKVIEFAKAKNAGQLIFISSSCTQLDKKNRYSLSKLRAEELVIRSGIPYTIIRPNYIYGPGNTQFMSIVSLMKKTKILPVIGDGKFIVAPVYEEDLTEAIVSCVENKNAYNKVYSICGEEIMFNDFLYAIASSLNLSRRLLHINEKMVSLLTYFYDKEFIYSFQDRHGNYTAAAEDLYYKPVALHGGLNKSLTGLKKEQAR